MSSPIAGDDDRAPAVEAMFDQIAPTYDRANRVLSLGLDQWWRRSAIQALGNPKTVLDLCAGTLDLSRILLDGSAEQVIAIDFSAEMLAHGANKFGPDENIQTIRADARALPLNDDSVDGIVAGFGLRNVPDLPRAITECARVLRPGGRLVVLDFFRPSTAVSRLLQGSYNRFIVPLAGGAISGSKEAYRYLEKSIGAFMSADEFVALLAEHGFDAQHRSMFPPVANLVTATRGEAENGP